MALAMSRVPSQLARVGIRRFDLRVKPLAAAFVEFHRLLKGAQDFVAIQGPRRRFSGVNGRHEYETFLVVGNVA
jgi:hypothetical protein